VQGLGEDLGDGAYLTTRPRYMTAVRWLMCLATSRSWVTDR
jgi:hypothetical protein